ncbi:hypothetical protein B0H14DRAFT_3585053 [Mycena olivaceomarginata]|nr:hypothetical protein B0H14DRAFT_3585053 [Mycena olivaceomarginata]
MDRGLMLPHSSSLFPAVQATSIPIQTTRHTTALPPGGLILELVSLSTGISPVRFVFPALVLPSPAVFLWETELHIVAVTDTGSLYRLVLPLDGGVDLWLHQTANTWTREYHIKNFFRDNKRTCSRPRDALVVISQPSGSILRLETEFLGSNGSEVDRTVFQHASFLSSLTSSSPLYLYPSNGSEIISIATHQWPTDVGHVWTISRDRNLRFWKAKIGWLQPKLCLTPGQRINSSARRCNHHTSCSTRNTRRCLRVFSTPTNEDHIYLLAFIPTPSSPASGGSFQLLERAHCHLQDFMVIADVCTLYGTAKDNPWLKKTVLTPLTSTRTNNIPIPVPRSLAPLPLSSPRCTPRSQKNIAAVVGCTVNLNRDPHTGALQHATYWSALKRDWEGFIARCRELERSARWPLVLGAKGRGDIIVVEREPEDLPIRLRRNLEVDRPVEPPHDIFGILWGLQSKLGAQFMLSLESRLLDIIHQENAFSFADIIQDQETLDEGAKSWMAGRLQTISDIDASTRTALDVIGGFDSDVKREEDEVELLLPPPHSDWSRALTATYITATVNARYDLCLSLLTLLFFFAEQLDDWDLLSWRRQPAGDPSGSKSAGEDVAADDVISRLRNMQVSRSLRGSHFAPTYSLVHRLIVQPADTVGLPGSAHRYLDSTGLLQSISPANATKYEVIFCERLRALGYYETAREIISCLPRTAGVTYVHARLWLNVGRADDAAYLMEKVAGAFGPENALTTEDSEALSFVLPASDPFDTAFFFYLHASKLFKMASLVQHEVSFTQLALSVAPLDADTSSLWNTVIKGYTDLSLYDDAHSSLIATPYEKQKRECVGQLVYRMCEDNAVEKLVSFNFPGFDDEVEEALAFKARNVDPRIQPSYSRILYSWHTFRGDHRNAALVMYQRARKLQDPHCFRSFVQKEAYMVAINSLSLVDQRNAWFLLPVQPHKRRRLSRHIPESKFTPGTHDSEIVDLSEIQYELALLSARLEIIQREPALSSFGDLPPESIVLRLAQSNRFSLAMATASSLSVDMTNVFAHLTTQCLRLSRNPNAVIQEDNSDWLLTDKVSSWPGTAADRGWRYLRQSLERHDGPDTDYKYTKITLETILGLQRTSPPPPWLIHSLEADARLSRDPAKHAAATWLPYTLIDQLLVAATALDSPPAGLSQLRTEIANRVKRMQKHSNFTK